MAKRGATRELNHDNWNEEEEPEEAGKWKPASSEAIQGRVIKQARRRLAADSQDEVRFLSIIYPFFFINNQENLHYSCSSLNVC